MKKIITLTVQVPDAMGPSPEWLERRIASLRDVLEPHTWERWRGVDGSHYLDAQMYAEGVAQGVAEGPEATQQQQDGP